MNITIDEIISNTKSKNLPSPLKEEVLSSSQIKSEKRDDERWIAFYKKAFMFENNPINNIDRYENYEREF